MTGGWSTAPNPCPGFPVLPWDKLLWASLAVVALLPGQEVPPPVSESSILPPLLHPAPQPFLSLGINTRVGNIIPRSHKIVYPISAIHFELLMLLTYTFEHLYGAINIRNKTSLFSKNG
jgi:hypothetical protein